MLENVKRGERGKKVARYNEVKNNPVRRDIDNAITRRVYQSRVSSKYANIFLSARYFAIYRDSKISNYYNLNAQRISYKFKFPSRD